LITYQILGETRDLSVSAGDIVSKLIHQLHSLYSPFLMPHTKYVAEDVLEKWRVKEVKQIQELDWLFEKGLREIGDMVSDGRIASFTSDQIIGIIEARFEVTTLSEAIVKGIERDLEY